MILEILAQYQNIIISHEIVKFRVVGNAYQFICKVELIDSSFLFVKDYLFLDGSRKYSFHWQKKEGQLIIRWDNAPHHQDVPSFPYHKHVDLESNILESPPVKLAQVLEYIHSQIGKS